MGNFDVIFDLHLILILKIEFLKNFRMIRRENRLRREFIFRKSLEEKQKSLEEKREKIRNALENNTLVFLLLYVEKFVIYEYFQKNRL